MTLFGHEQGGVVALDDSHHSMAKTTLKKGSAYAALVALAGASTVAILNPHLDRWEGNELVGYRDLVGIATRCRGVIEGAVVGRRYTPTECEEVNAKAALEHAVPVLQCTPGLKNHPEQLAMAISLAYNIGGTRYCTSTVARRFNAGDWQGACEAFLMWNKAGGKVVRGLVNRRKDETAKCMKGLIV